MAEAQPGAGALYEERQWVPFWICAAVFGSVVAIGLVAAAIASASTASGVWSVGFPIVVAIAFVLSVLVWASNYFRKLTVEADGLQFGSKFVAFGYVESVRSVDRDEAGRLAKSMLYAPNVPSTWGNRKRQAGSWRRPWAKYALYVRLKAGAPAITNEWLIGTRHPQELLAAIESGIGRAGAPRPTADAVPA